MPITISFERLSSDRVAVHLNGQQVSDFEPAALLVDQPLAPHRPTPTDPCAYGQRLWAALGGTTLGNAVNKLPNAPNLNSMVAIRTNDPDLAAIPWEYLHNGTDFLMFKKLLVRVVPNAPVPAPPDPTKPWRLVVMDSDPLVREVRDDSGKLQGYAKLPRLKVVRELDTLRDTLLKQEAPMRWHRIAPTATALIDELVPSEPVLFHYTGHGDVVDGRPILCFDDGTGCMDPHPVPDLAANLRGLVHLAFLNACRTADSCEPGANLALALVQNGIPVVLGTQYTVLDQAASMFAETFYRQLAHGNHPAQALYRARLQLKNKYRNEPQEWALCSILLRATTGKPSSQN
ncbi:MAG: tetratricopeptide repeat protein [Chloroflexi bacterium AL-W]|nr:tetratricopeptide repeat protein [Chloroflexi bacterium AL-N1]NOK66081.1 tetratricopeptide repeat protein [Chloroflexi bacterium AL-N10]NOK72962.1 tetratricopeptide repeat protein [Chloroflexi bacterium AL-N5]NOK79859.1 tetratricopeptide repeat protein [Chloroflexi bacterium AL-W]NOK88285.1 tetratricopeptide repeat protein [Chloroflexi bacterium AL-N15]